jgi:sigma-B regulation protein RsbU (phosphoserine phosphatase)
MNRHRLSTGVCVLWAACTLLFSGCRNGEETVSIKLDSGWQWSLSADSGFIDLPAADMGQLQKLVPGEKGIIYLRHHFTVPAQLRGKDISCYLGRITMADVSYINGVEIGNEGRFPPDEFSAWNKARLYHIPSDLLHDKSENTLLVKIYTDGEGSIVSGPFIGLTDDASFASASEDFWNAGIHLLCAFFMVIIAAYHFLLFIKRPVEKENLLFAVINVISSLYLSVFYLYELPGCPWNGMSFFIFQKIFSSALPFILPYLVTSFVNTYLGRNENKAVLIVRILFAVIPAAVVLFMPDYSSLRMLRTYTQPLLVPPMMYIMYILIEQKIRKHDEINSLILGFSPLVGAFLADIIIHDALGYYNFPYISSLGWMLVILSLLFLLAGRFADARTEAEYLNKNLEKKVSDRTKELTEINQKLEDANERSERDMKLAVHVQRSFYPKRAPVTEGWDIAYGFFPMSGVSGDLYDFYTDGTSLAGVSLFDVSGHGISSGLVAMLAKTVIEKEFRRGSDKPLAEVMTGISDSIAQEKGNIENYLTGILLRMNGAHVEYVNAGHPSMLYRTGGGTIQKAALSGKDPQGPVVGIAGMPAEFNGITFTMKKDDAVMIYTDCLSEARNAEGEQFGEERITRSFAGAYGDTANEKLRTVLEQLKKYKGDVPLNDDLTVIVIRRAV